MFTVRQSCFVLPLIALLALVCLGTTPTASASALADGYNAYIFGDFYAQSSDVEGRVAVGGNMDVNHYSVGYTLTGPQAGGNALVVGGDLHYRGGQVYHGNTLVGGTYYGPTNYPGGPVYPLSVSPYTVTDHVTPLPTNFVSQKASLTALSAQLAAMDATGSTNYQWSTLTATGAGSNNIQVFNIDGNDLKLASTFQFLTGSAPTDATLIFNVSGTDAEMFSMGILGLNTVRENVIFNFYEATTLLVGSIDVPGTILAPLAHINGGWGQINGQVIANSFSGPTQINEVYFCGELPIPDPYDPQGGPDPDPQSNTATPEPASAGLMTLTALGALLATRRRRSSSR